MELNESKLIDPQIDIASSVPNTSGVYFICLRESSNLPQNKHSLIMRQFNGLEVVYIGRAKKSMRTRDFRQHFNGNAGRSTLRKSLGVLMGLKLIPRSERADENKSKFDINDEIQLTAWMKANLIMFCMPVTDCITVEMDLIAEYQPPLNIKSNNSLDNILFRKDLCELRNLTKVGSTSKS